MSTILHVDARQDSQELDCCHPARLRSQCVITQHCGEAMDTVHLSLVLNPFILDFALHFLRRVAETRKPRNCTVYMQPFNIAALLAIEDDKCLLAFRCTLYCGRCLHYHRAFRALFLLCGRVEDILQLCSWHSRLEMAGSPCALRRPPQWPWKQHIWSTASHMNYLHLTDIGFQPSCRGNQNRERICGFWVTSALFMYV